MDETCIIIQLSENGTMQMGYKGMPLSRAIFWLDYFHNELMRQFAGTNGLPPVAQPTEPEPLVAEEKQDTGQ